MEDFKFLGIVISVKGVRIQVTNLKLTKKLETEAIAFENFKFQESVVVE